MQVLLKRGDWQPLSDPVVKVDVELVPATLTRCVRHQQACADCREQLLREPPGRACTHASTIESPACIQQVPPAGCCWRPRRGTLRGSTGAAASWWAQHAPARMMSRAACRLDIFDKLAEADGPAIVRPNGDIAKCMEDMRDGFPVG